MEAHSPEVRHRTAEAIDARADRVGVLIDQAFDVIAGAMAAEAPTRTQTVPLSSVHLCTCV